MNYLSLFLTYIFCQKDRPFIDEMGVIFNSCCPKHPPKIIFGRYTMWQGTTIPKYFLELRQMVLRGERFEMFKKMLNEISDLGDVSELNCIIIVQFLL